MCSYIKFRRCGCNEKKYEPIRFFPVVAKRLKAASVPSRMKILLNLARGPHCVCDLMTHTKFSQTLISHHLADLAEAELVKGEKKGSFMDYSLTEKGRKIIKIIEELKS